MTMMRYVFAFVAGFTPSSLALADASSALPYDAGRDRAAESYVDARLDGANSLVKEMYRGMLSDAFLWGWESSRRQQAQP
jgi:hypothetical protein